jgi:hypothetical protein
MLRASLLRYQRISSSESYFTAVSKAIWSMSDHLSSLQGDGQLLQTIIRIISIEDTRSPDCNRSMWSVFRYIAVDACQNRDIMQIDGRSQSGAILEFLEKNATKVADAISRISHQLDAQDLESTIKDIVASLSAESAQVFLRVLPTP